MVEPHARDDGMLNQSTRFSATPNCSNQISWARHQRSPPTTKSILTGLPMLSCRCGGGVK